MGGVIDTLDELGMIGAGMSARETFSGLKPKSGGWSIFNAVTAFIGYANTFSNLAKKCHPTIAASISGLLLVFNGLAGDVAVAVTGILIVSSPVFAIAFMIIMVTLIHFVNELVTTITSGLCDGSLAFRRSYGVKREV